MNERNFDAIIIGSGIGSMTCAALLAQIAKKRVLVLERHFKLGGQTHTFRRPPGYEWDVGLHYVGHMAPDDPERRLMDLVTGGAVNWERMPDPFEVFHYPEVNFAVPVGRSAYCEKLIREFPAHEEAIRGYFDDIKRASSWMASHMTQKAFPRWLSGIARWAARRREPLALQTTQRYLDRHIADPVLQALLASQWPDYGVPPQHSAFCMHALATGSFYDGGYYPVGGSQQIADAFEAMLARHGGECLLNHEVDELLMEGDRTIGVRATRIRGDRRETSEFRAPIVVSGIGALPTYSKLIPMRLASALRQQARAFPTGLSAVTLYLGLNQSPHVLGMRGENHWIYERADHDWVHRHAHEALEGNPTHAFVSFPSMKGDTKTRHTAEILCMVDFSRFSQWASSRWMKRSQSYEQLKETLSRGLLNLAERHIPGLSNLVAYSEVSTPLTMEHFTGCPQGAFYGVPAIPRRFKARWLEITTPVEGLFLTGSDVASLGVMGAAMGGMLAAGKMMGPLGFAEIIHHTGHV